MQDSQFRRLHALAGTYQQLTGYETVPLDDKNFRSCPPECKKQSTVVNNAVYMPDDAKKPSSDPNKPEIGDLRISFQAVQPATVSVMACQAGNSFAPGLRARGPAWSG